MPIVKNIVAWFGPSVHSIKGYATRNEAYKSYLTAGIAALIAFFGVVQTNPEKFADSKYAALITFICVQVIDHLRRVSQGATVVRSLTAQSKPPEAVEIVQVEAPCKE